MNKEEIKDYITELESMFELSKLEEHRINILKVGIYIKQLQQENQKLKIQISAKEEVANKYKEVIDKAIEYIENCNPNIELHSEFLDESYLSNYGAKELLDILKEVSE